MFETGFTAWFGKMAAEFVVTMVVLVVICLGFCIQEWWKKK